MKDYSSHFKYQKEKKNGQVGGWGRGLFPSRRAHPDTGYAVCFLTREQVSSRGQRM